jgi:flagellar motor component MotA
MAKVSNKDILRKLNNMKKNARNSGLFNIEAKLDLRIKKIKSKNKNKSIFDF